MQLPSFPRCDVARHPQGSEPSSGFGFLVFSGSVGAAWSADGFAGAVVAVFWVEGELSDDLAGCGVDDADVVAVDEQDDAGSFGGGGRPMPMWWRCPSTRRVTAPAETRSVRTRGSLSVGVLPGLALGRVV